MTSIKYIGVDVHMESISICVRNSVGKIVMECVIETKASTILQFLDGLRGDLRVVFEEGTWATWLYDLLKPHVMEVLVCNTRENAVRDGSKSDRIDARKLRDSGIGFDPEDASRWNGLGLTSIRERLKLVNGKSSWIRNHSAGQRFRLACLSVPK